MCSFFFIFFCYGFWDGRLLGLISAICVDVFFLSVLVCFCLRDMVFVMYFPSFWGYGVWDGFCLWDGVWEVLFLLS